MSIEVLEIEDNLLNDPNFMIPNIWVEELCIKLKLEKSTLLGATILDPELFSFTDDRLFTALGINWLLFSDQSPVWPDWSDIVLPVTKLASSHSFKLLVGIDIQRSLINYT